MAVHIEHASPRWRTERRLVVDGARDHGQTRRSPNRRVRPQGVPGRWRVHALVRERPVRR
jgi:hypothetical protein